MKKLFLILAILLPVTAAGYGDHRGHNLDSLERITSRYTPAKLLSASRDEKLEYSQACRELAWGYLNLDGPKCTYYARQAIAISEGLGGCSTIFDMSILIGQTFWAREEYDSARVYYGRAGDILSELITSGKETDPHEIEAMQSRLWGTLGNFYAAQDSVEQFAYYYGKAGELFEKWGWMEDCSTLHCNIAEIYSDNGDFKSAGPEYEKALDLALQSGDSLIIARAMYGMGRYYNETGKVAKALKYLADADEYYGNHPKEEAIGRADTLEVMRDSYRLLYRSARLLAVGSIVLLLMVGGLFFILKRFRRTSEELSAAEEALEEMLKDLRPATGDMEGEIMLTDREIRIVHLLVEGKSTKEIADEIHLGTNTVLWYRKRIYAKFDVHNVAALTAEALRRGI